MSQPIPERLYQLLPTIYRQRDLAQGEPLRALLALIEQDLRAHEDDIAGLYENWFIETADDWAVPYIGDLLGMRGLSDPTRRIFSQRAYVANAIGYRRRKGVTAVLARVAQDVSGWNVRAVEFFNLLGMTQHLHHLRPGRGATVDLRDRAALEWLETPFTSTARQIDVRRIASRAGTHNLSNVGLFVWRLQSYPVADAVARQVATGCYTFNPLGVDQQLLTSPQPQSSLGAGAEALSLPVPISRQAFATDLLNCRDQPADSLYYGSELSLHVVVDGAAISPLAIVSRDLSAWARPAESDPATGTPIKVAVDVVRGRLAFAVDQTPQSVLVRYSYGFAADIGGGPYVRRHTLADQQQATWQIDVRQNYVPGNDRPDRTDVRPVPTVGSLQEALAQWRDHCHGQDYPRGIITIADDAVYQADLIIDVPANGSLVIQADDGRRPAIRSTSHLEVAGLGAGAMLTLNGLLINTAGVLLAVRQASDPANDPKGQLKLTITHCAFVPIASAAPGTAAALPSLGSRGDVTRSQVAITYSLVGPLRLADDLAELSVQDSVIDGGQEYAIAAPQISGDQVPGYGPAVILERVTLFGKVRVRELSVASEVIFREPVLAQRRQSGMVRFSYIPDGSATPRRYRCQPDLAIEAEEIRAANAKGQPLDAAERAAIRSRLLALLQPSFTSDDYRHPGYAQLGRDCPPEIAAGAENGAEIGVFHHLLQPQREANLLAILDEYLPVGLEAGVFYIT